MRRVREELQRRLTRWRRAALPIGQASLAAGLSWLVAVHVVGHPSPFFAPIAAVICLGITLGQRLRRGIELVVGVSIGIAVGDLWIPTIGTGSWQIALVVALAMSAAVLLDGGPVITIQSAASAVLVATLYPSGGGHDVSRMVDALVGGAIALLIAALLPANPLTVAQSKGGRLLGELAAALHGVAAAIKERDGEKAAVVLARLRDTQRTIDDFRTALEAADEIATIAPIRWRRRRALDRYLALFTPVDYALRNTRVLVRRAVAALRDGEAIPGALPEAIDKLAGGVEMLSIELAAGQEPAGSRRRIQTVANSASAELIGDGAFSTRVVLAQLRSTAVDMLQAAGMSSDDAFAALPALGRRGDSGQAGPRNTPARVR